MEANDKIEHAPTYLAHLLWKQKFCFFTWLCFPDGIPENSGEFPIPDPFSTLFFPIPIPIPLPNGKIVPATARHVRAVLIR